MAMQQVDGLNLRSPVSSAVRQHVLDRPHGGVDYEADSFYLISPLNTWEGDLRVGEREVYRGAIRPGMLRLAGPTDLERKAYPESARALVIRMPERWLRKVLARSRMRERPEELTGRPILYVDSAVRRVTRLMIEKGSSAMITEGLAEALLGLLAGQHVGGKRAAGSRELTDGQMKMSCMLVDGNLQSPPSLGVLAAGCDLAAKEYSKRFFRKNGITPYAWMMERRIRHAEERLRESDVPASELALELGFASQSHFTEAFRRRTGVSPVRWRRDVRRVDPAA